MLPVSMVIKKTSRKVIKCMITLDIPTLFILGEKNPILRRKRRMWFCAVISRNSLMRNSILEESMASINKVKPDEASVL